MAFPLREKIVWPKLITGKVPSLTDSQLQDSKRELRLKVSQAGSKTAAFLRDEYTLAQMCHMLARSLAGHAAAPSAQGASQCLSYLEASNALVALVTTGAPLSMLSMVSIFGSKLEELREGTRMPGRTRKRGVKFQGDAEQGQRETMSCTSRKAYRRIAGEGSLRIRYHASITESMKDVIAPLPFCTPSIGASAR